MCFQLKYSEEMGKLTCCPPDGVSQRACTAYRFVHADLADQRNYQPPAIIKPGRKWKNESDHCEGYGLSFFECPDQATQFFKIRAKVSQNLSKLVGSHIATVAMVEPDGLATDLDSEGHFSLFEAASTSFQGRLNLFREIAT